jgi:hypothetical protein
MGERSDFDSQIALHIRAEFPFAFEVHLIHNGEKIKSSTEKRIVHQPIHPGFYRVEVYLKERTPMRKDIPWILSNPIFFLEKNQ